MKGGEVDAEKLISLAAREIEEEVLPAVPGSGRYRLRLVLNALKIAARDLASGDSVTALKRGELAGLLPPSLSGETASDDLATVESALRSAIRNGDHDGDSDLYRSLLNIAEARNRLVR